jgi:penicillin-binding protein 1B
MSKYKRIAIYSACFLLVATAGFGIWLYKLDQTITTSIAEKQLIPTIEFYSAPITFMKGQKFKPSEIASAFERLRYRKRDFGQAVLSGDYARWTREECEQSLGSIPDETLECFAFRARPTSIRNLADLPVSIITVAPDDSIGETFQGAQAEPAEKVELESELFAQFIGNQSIIRRRVQLGDTPPLCLQALLSIEDPDFLEHGGVSYRGILRAAFRNLTGGRLAQGGSTITQQLVKNYFLTPDKTFRRKFKEIFMALLLELRATKDEILESYVNEIYMGQEGSFQIRGYGAGAEHYFSKRLEDLSIDECALMAAIVNAPGIYDPFRHPDKALARRELVLSKMTEFGHIDEESKKIVMQAALPKSTKRILSEPAPYFVDAVSKQLEAMHLDMTQGLRVYTTLDQTAQEAAQKAVRNGVEYLEKNNKNVKEIKEKTGKQLEGLLISSDPKTGYIRAAVGGRSFKMSQFNRLTSGHRQVGSIMKPFVFLAAMMKEENDEFKYNPLTVVEDSRFKFKYEKQVWKPENYGNKYFGEVPIYFALKESLNSVTARVAVDVGLDQVVDLARMAGASSELRPLPSLALGAFEMYPYEVLQMYSTLSQLGEMTPLTFITKVETAGGETQYEHKIQTAQQLDKVATALVVGMMKQTIASGTGRAVPLMGFKHPTAGKTGTTSDYKDSWFAGFTPRHVAVAWVGYDDNTSAKLTGASGALPIWVTYMNAFGTQFPPEDFPWPDGTKVVELSVSDQVAYGVQETEKKPLEPAFLVFRESDEIQKKEIIEEKLEEEIEY